MKQYIGKLAYSVQAVAEIIRGRQEILDLWADGELLRKDYALKYVWIYNGKYGGGRMILNPLGLLNDGFIEIFYFENTGGGRLR